MGDATTERAVAIELRDIVKRFPGVVANDGVNVTVRAGTIHAIIGENGSGKSTLMKTLYGAHRPDEGTIIVNGAEQSFRSPRDAIAVGIGMVFQHFQLADNFTVWENIVLGDEPGTPWNLRRGIAIRQLRDLGRRYGLEVDPNALVSDLGVGQKQRAEILKVLYRGAKIIILDEPTAVLVPHEVDELFASMRELTAAGATAIFISHKLDEVLRFADAITVIRAGKTVGEVPDPSQVDAHQLAEMMVGSELPSPETRESTVTTDVALEVVGLTVDAEGGAPALLDDVSFTIHRGEVVGIAGIEGNGQTELVEAILGVVDGAVGRIELFGEDITNASTRDRRTGGLGYIPEDRHKDGMVLPFPLWENAVLGHQSQAPFGDGIWIKKAGAVERTQQIIQDFDVRTPSAFVPALTLSGGNQQKLIVGREMTTDPKVLIASHPTRGIDVGAQAAIWDVIRTARAAGLGVLLISADLEELIGLSDTLYVIYRGKLAARLDPADVTPKVLGSYMTGAGAPDMNRVLATAKRILARLGPNVLAPLIAGAVAIAVSSVALLLSGYSPSEAFSAMWKVLDSKESVVGIINKAGWYYVAGVAVAIGFKMGLFNIGADGQYRLGALFAAYFGAKADLPAVLHVLYIVLIAVVVAAAWAAIAGILKVTRGVNEVISTIMLNFIATGLTAWLLNTYFRNQTGGLTAETKVIPKSGRIPSLNALVEALGFNLGRGVVLQGYVVVAILVGVGYYVLLFRSRYGFELRVTGMNPSAAKASGVNPKRMILTTIMLSGAVAGLIGMGPLLSDSQYYKYGDQFPLTLGFTGLSLALLGRNNPVGIALAAIVWAGIERATQPLSIIGIPQEIGIILQGSFLLSAVIVFEVFSRRAQEQAIRDAAARAAPRTMGAPA